MATKDNSIGAHIDRLAVQTGAPDAFVQRIRELFSTKGISLDGDCEPYMSALDHAFQRERSIRQSAMQTRENLERLQRQLEHFNEACRKQLSRMKSLQVNLGRDVPALSGEVDTKEVQIVEARKRGGFRSGRDRSIVVPGPKDVQ